MTGSRKAALVVMARAPVPGEVKTRLQPRLTPQESADLYHAFLLDTLDLAASIEGCVPFLTFTPADQDFFAAIAPAGTRLFPQSEGDLGDRMFNAFLHLERLGYTSIVLVGSDIPTIQPQAIHQAFDALRTADVCLGPSTDGGYYLIGARCAWATLFLGMDWGTGTVLEATTESARDSNLSVRMLETETDIDTVDDLLWLRDEIGRLRESPGARVPPRTASYLKQLGM